MTDHPDANSSAFARRRTVVTRKVGVYDVMALCDATGAFFRAADEMFPDATPRDWERARKVDSQAFGANGTWYLDFRCYAIRRPDGRVTLVDVGVGPEGSPASAWAPVPGRLPEVLAECGTDPSDVHQVVLTHLHEDHCGWSVGPDGTPMFPNARYVVQQDEIAALEADGSEILGYVVEPLRRTGQLSAISGAVCLDGDATRTGRSGGRASRAGSRIKVIPTPGHTLGHQSVFVEGAGREVVITGDVLVHAVQLVAPDVSYHYERSPQLARVTRHALLAQAERSGALLATAHLRQPFVPVR